MKPENLITIDNENSNNKEEDEKLKELLSKYHDLEKQNKELQLEMDNLNKQYDLNISEIKTEFNLCLKSIYYYISQSTVLDLKSYPSLLNNNTSSLNTFLEEVKPIQNNNNEYKKIYEIIYSQKDNISIKDFEKHNDLHEKILLIMKEYNEQSKTISQFQNTLSSSNQTQNKNNKIIEKLQVDYDVLSNQNEENLQLIDKLKKERSTFQNHMNTMESRYSNIQKELRESLKYKYIYLIFNYLLCIFIEEKKI